MYIPSAFSVTDKALLHGLIKNCPLGILVSSGSGGLVASPIPFLLAEEEGEHGVLRAHLAKANSHWKALREAAECLVVFQGPDGYVSPSWYPSKKVTQQVVPTWNYTTVHAWGAPHVIEDDAEWLRRQLAGITRFEEHVRAREWTLENAPADFIEAQIKAVVGLEIRITRMEGKWKMSQNRSAEDKQGVLDGMRNPRDPHCNPAVADIVAKS